MSRIAPPETADVSASGLRICAPGNVRVWRNSEHTAVVSWDTLYSACELCPNAESYEFFGEGITTKSVVQPPVELAGLMPNGEYLLYVSAKAAGNNVSAPTAFRVRAPGNPGIPQVVDLTERTVSLRWVPSYPEYESTRYRIYLNGVLVKQVATPEATLTHLQSHSEYRVAVRAVIAGVVTEPSTTTFKTRVNPASNLRFNHRNGICRVAWEPVFNKKPTYEIGINDKLFNAGAGRWGFNFKLSDVSPGPVPHPLRFVVVAILDGVRSEAATLDVIVADDVPPSRPGAPTVSDVTETSATVKWESAEDNVGVAGYRVVLNALVVISTANTYFTFNGLMSGVYHSVFIRAQDKDGNLSPPSPLAVFKTTGPAPSPRPAPPQASITDLTSTTARLDWVSADVVSGARVWVNDEYLADILFLSSYILTKLIPDTVYTISISVFDVWGQLSDPTIIVYEPKDRTAPSAPGNLRIENMSSGSVTLAWEPSEDDVAILGYWIYRDDVYLAQTPLNQNTIVDMLPGRYSFKVCAVDFSGNTSSAAAINVVIAESSDISPTNFRFYVVGLSPRLQWDAPKISTGLIRYDIVLTGTQGNPVSHQTTDTVLSPILIPFARYDVSITAVYPNERSLPLISEFVAKG